MLKVRKSPRASCHPVNTYGDSKSKSGCVKFGAFIFTVLTGVIGSLGGHRVATVWTGGIAICFIVLAVCFWFTDREQEREKTRPSPAPPVPSAPEALKSPNAAAALNQSPVPTSTPKSRFLIKRDRFEVSWGTNTSIIRGAEPNPFFGDIEPDGNLVVFAEGKVVDGKLFVNAHLVGGQVQLIGNEVTGLPAGWDANCDEDMVEVINSEGIPVLQVEYKTGQLVLIRGVFINKRRVMIASDEGLDMPGENNAWQTIAKKMFSVTFKYPGDSNRGIRVKR